MKNNSGKFCGLSRRGVGAAVLAFCVFTPVLRADVVVDNIGTPVGTFGGNYRYAQVFTMSATGGSISSLALELDVLATGSPANVYLYSVNGSGAPTGPGTLLGTVNPGSTGNGQSIVVGSLYSATLAAGVSYAIALNTSSAINWNFVTSSSSGGNGSLLKSYSSNDGGVSWNTGISLYSQMDLVTVPEVSKTGLIMGFGALAIAVCGNLRRKFRPAVSGLA